MLWIFATLWHETYDNHILWKSNESNHLKLHVWCTLVKYRTNQHLTHDSETGTHSEIQAATIHPYLYVCDEAA